MGNGGKSFVYVTGWPNDLEIVLLLILVLILMGLNIAYPELRRPDMLFKEIPPVKHFKSKSFQAQIQKLIEFIKRRAWAYKKHQPKSLTTISGAIQPPTAVVYMDYDNIQDFFRCYGKTLQEMEFFSILLNNFKSDGLKIVDFLVYVNFPYQTPPASAY